MELEIDTPNVIVKVVIDEPVSKPDVVHCGGFAIFRWTTNVDEFSEEWFQPDLGIVFLELCIIELAVHHRSVEPFDPLAHSRSFAGALYAAGFCNDLACAEPNRTWELWAKDDLAVVFYLSGYRCSFI